MNQDRLPAPEQAQQAADSCVQCGACMAHCPAYRASRREPQSARAKLALLEGLLNGELGPSARLGQAISACLLCGRCSANCPNQAPATEGLLAGREVWAQRAGLPLVKRLILQKALPRPERLAGLVRAGRLARPLVQPLAQAALPLLSGLHLRLAGLERLEDLGPLPARPFLSQAPRELAGPKGSPRLGLFVGCVANYLRPGLAQRAAELLSRVGTVVIPPRQVCCGLPSLAAGLGDGARELFKRNLEAFSAARVDLLVTACGSCAHTLARELPRLAPGRQSERLARSVREISQVLAEHPGRLAGLGAGLGPVAVHDPCHLKVGLDVWQEPRAMLAAAGVELVEMDGADQCCGGGGLFSLNHPGLSQQVFAPRGQAFEQSGARVLATSCTGCLMQWRQGLDPHQAVLHPIEFLSSPG